MNIHGRLTDATYEQINRRNKMRECTFCEAKVPDCMKLPGGWGRAKLSVGKEVTEVTFCPKHRKEAEEKLDLALQGGTHEYIE